MKFQIILLLCLAMQARGSMYFQPLGQLNPSPSYGHVHLVVDTQIISKQLLNLQVAIGYIRKSVHTITHKHVEKRANNFLIKAHLDIENMIQEFYDLTDIVYSQIPDKARMKRFLELLLAIGSIALSLFNQGEILHLQGQISDVVTRQHHIVDILQEHEVAVHNLQHDVLSIRDGFLSLANIVDEASAITKIHDAEIQIVMALAELRRTMVCMQSGLQQLLNHRIPICFLNNTQIKISLGKLFKSAAAQHLQPISVHLAAFLQYDTSFLFEEGRIHIFVHVPLFDNNKVLDILQFHNAPTQISDLLALKLSPVDDILAVGKDGLHTSMSHTDLTSMTKYGHMYFSDTALTLNIQLNTSCLGMIYSQDFHNIKSICPAKFLETDEQFTNVGPGEYIFYTSNPQTIQIRCQSGVKHLAVEHTEKIRLPDNCEVKSKNFVTRTGHDFNLESAIRAWPTTWNVSGLLFDLGATTLAVQVAKLKLIHYPAMPIRDLHRMMATTTAATHWWFTAPICAATTLLILIFAYLGLRYWQLRKNGPSAPAAAIEEAAA